jgi:tetratricopeptide (TPR) repeat protein
MIPVLLSVTAPLRRVYSLGLGELRDAERQMSSCIAELRIANLPRLSSFVENRLASVLAIRASLRCSHFMHQDGQATRDLEEARYLYNKMLREAELTEFGQAAIDSEMGDTYSFQEDWRAARSYYDRATDRSQQNNDIYRIMSAKCDIQLGEMGPAKRKLREVDGMKLRPMEYVDYALQYAALAIKSGNAEDVELAKRYLDQAEPRWPYFRDMRDKYRIALLSREDPERWGRQAAEWELFRRF